MADCRNSSCECGHTLRDHWFSKGHQPCGCSGCGCWDFKEGITPKLFTQAELDAAVEQAKAELRELRPCGHPAACEVAEMSPIMVPGPPIICSACKAVEQAVQRAYGLAFCEAHAPAELKVDKQGVVSEDTPEGFQEWKCPCCMAVRERQETEQAVAVAVEECAQFALQYQDAITVDAGGEKHTSGVIASHIRELKPNFRQLLEQHDAKVWNACVDALKEKLAIVRSDYAGSEAFDFYLRKVADDCSSAAEALCRKPDQEG